MDILFITPFIPRENAKLAGVNCTYNLLKLIKENIDCSIDAIGTINSDDDKIKLESNIFNKSFFFTINKNKKISNILKNISSPLLMAVRYDNRVRKKLRELSLQKKYDYIFVDYTQNSKYIIDIKECFPDSQTILIEQDVSFLGYERKYLASKSLIHKLAYFFEYKRLKKSECKIVNEFDFVCTLNEKDSNLLGELKNKIILKPFIKDWNVKKRDHEGFNIMFWGAMNRKENEDAVLNFIENIWPHVNKNDCKFFVVGANPSERIKNLKSDNVIVTGFVEDATGYFSQMDISVVPLRLGAGIKIKVLESMINGIPVVTSSVGAEGININNGQTGFVTDNNYDFANYINELKSNTELVNRISVLGRKIAIEEYSFESNIKTLKNIIR